MGANKSSFNLSWWKILTIVLLIYTILAGFFGKVPELPRIYESIRNLYFHVPMWFCMVILLTVSFISSIIYLRNQGNKQDIIAVECVKTSLVFGVLGLVTGMLWAEFAWNDFWNGDPKQNGTAIGMLLYLAYLVLRGSFSDEQQKARVSAIFNILAFPSFISLIFVLPRLSDSLHPGNGGNPGFNQYDLNSNMRMVFYPAVIGFSLLGWWITSLKIRMKELENRINGID